MVHRNFVMRLVGLFGLLILLTDLTASQAALSAGDNSCSTDHLKNSEACNTLQGFGSNVALDNATGVTIAGGGEIDLPNRVTGNFGSVGGGIDNQAGAQAVVAGGSDNNAEGYRTSVGGGSSNHAITAYSTIAGGTNNTTSAIHATIGGGSDNTASARDATIAGGSGNIASFTGATVGGGGYNTADSLQATVGGGGHNAAIGTYSTVSGGSGNRARALDTAIGGGSGNSASADEATISGGLANRATAKFSTVGGGSQNLAGSADDASLDGRYATVGGGQNNTASGSFSTIPGGSFNRADGAFSFAAGRRARVDPAHPGTFNFADSNDSDFTSLAPNEFAVRATGGVRFVTGIDAAGNPIASVRIAKGSGAWEFQSDASAKAHLNPVDGREILRELSQIPISTWNYKTEDSSVRHIGPMAQDLAIMGVGEDSHYINMVDANGIALAAIQGLDQIVRQEIDSRDAQIAELKAENAAQQSQLSALALRVSELEQKTKSSDALSPSGLTGGNLLFAGLGLIGLVKAIYAHPRR
ncbi:MAG: tail fiber domain-containing protein [Acidobacteriota bacterium]